MTLSDNQSDVETGTSVWTISVLLKVVLLLISIFIAKKATENTDKPKTWIFPLLALIFDVVPVLNFIPFIPTLLHIVTMVMILLAKENDNKQAVVN